MQDGNLFKVSSRLSVENIFHLALKKLSLQRTLDDNHAVIQKRSSSHTGSVNKVVADGVKQEENAFGYMGLGVVPEAIVASTPIHFTVPKRGMNMN